MSAMVDVAETADAAQRGVVEKFRIAELAARTGFTTAALRYYEELGLLEPPERSPGGYRLYTQRDVDRAQFIGRAKRLGLSLEDIHSLVDVWAGGQCSVTRLQLRGLVEAKIVSVRQQLEDTGNFLKQLEAVHERIENLVDSGSEEGGCGCAPELPPIEALQS